MSDSLRMRCTQQEGGKGGDGGEGMEWHSDGANGEFTMLMSLTGW